MILRFPPTIRSGTGPAATRGNSPSIANNLAVRADLLKKVVRINCNKTISVQRHDFGHQFVEAEFGQCGIVEQDKASGLKLRVDVQKISFCELICVIAVDITKTDTSAKVQGSSQNIRAAFPGIPCVKKLVRRHLKCERQIVLT